MGTQDERTGTSHDLHDRTLTPPLLVHFLSLFLKTFSSQRRKVHRWKVKTQGKKRKYSSGQKGSSVVYSFIPQDGVVCACTDDPYRKTVIRPTHLCTLESEESSDQSLHQDEPHPPPRPIGPPRPGVPDVPCRPGSTAHPFLEEPLSTGTNNRPSSVTETPSTDRDTLDHLLSCEPPRKETVSDCSTTIILPRPKPGVEPKVGTVSDRQLKPDH